MVAMVKTTSTELYGCERIGNGLQFTNTESKIAVFLEILASGSVLGLSGYQVH